MKRIILTGVVFLMVIAFVQGVAAAPATASPEDVTKSLLHFALKNFGFSVENLKLEKDWLTPDLYARLMKKANQPVPKGDAPDIEGDVFLDCQDSPTGFEFGKSTINGGKATVEVVLEFDKEKRHNKVLLQQVDGAWKVYDVVYDKDGNLTDLLK